MTLDQSNNGLVQNADPLSIQFSAWQYYSIYNSILCKPHHFEQFLRLVLICLVCIYNGLIGLIICWRSTLCFSDNDIPPLKKIDEKRDGKWEGGAYAVYIFSVLDNQHILCNNQGKRLKFLTNKTIICFFLANDKGYYTEVIDQIAVALCCYSSFYLLQC